MSSQPPENPKKRRRKVEQQPKSIYTLPVPSRAASLRVGTGSASRDGSIGQSGENKGKQRVLTNGDDFGQPQDARRPEASDIFKLRTQKGWETRRAHRRLLAEREDTDQFLNPEAGPSNYADLPSNDLLNSLHHYTSSFYETHDLLLHPREKPPRTQWATKKRLLLDREGLASPSLTEEGTKQEIAVDQYGERKISRATSRESAKVRKGEYRKRDMVGALDGTALLGLGVLVQEFIIEQLVKAGYRRAEPDHEGEDSAENGLGEDPAEMASDGHAVSINDEEEIAPATRKSKKRKTRATESS